MTLSDQCTLSRRSFLKRSTGAVAALSVAGFSFPTWPVADVPVGVQLFCFRHQLAEDFPGTMAQIAKLGFKGVEYADYFGYNAKELRAIMDDNGVKCCGTHIHIETLQGDELSKSIEFNLTLGNPYLIVRSLRDDRLASKDAILRTAEDLNEISEALKPHGLRTGYHCHAYSFEQTYDDQTIWDILGDNTSEDFVLQLDTGNAAHGGANVPEVIKRHPGKVNTMHIKPYTSGDEDPFRAYIGDDKLPWPEIFDLSEEVGGIEWYIVEYEHEAYPPLEALKTNLERVNGFGR